MPLPYLLLPAPRSLTISSGLLALGETATASFPDVTRERAGQLAARLSAASPTAWSVEERGLLQATLVEGLERQGYRLTITASDILLEAADEAGLFYGICTLAQILSQAQGSIRCLRIEDYPDFPVRGVTLYISSGKIPTMETLRDLCERLASWKVNQLHLCAEHAWGYESHPAPSAGKSPITMAEARELDGFCRERCLELVPCQNSFGHLSRWLTLPDYAMLADDPATARALCPTDPGSLALMASLYDELASNFTSPLVNAGCDEVPLGTGRSADACREKGEGRVYLEFLLGLHQALQARGKTMLCWADILQHYPELIPELPRDLILLEWGYESDHPFARNCKRIADSGIPYYVCPGTSSWNSLGGRTSNTLGNLVNAALNGQRHGAQGLLITDWGDNGHWHHQAISFPGFVYGAGVAWCLASNLDLALPEALSRYAYDAPDSQLGQLACDLGRACEATGVHTQNGSGLFIPLFESLDAPNVALWLRREGYERAIAHIEEVMAGATGCSPPSAGGRLALAELRQTAELMLHGARRGLMMVDRFQGRDVRDQLMALLADGKRLVEAHRPLWMARNRPGGYDEPIHPLIPHGAPAARMKQAMVTTYEAGLKT